MITLPSEIATSAGMFVFAIVQALILLVLAPLFSGISRMIRARIQSRRGPGRVTRLSRYCEINETSKHLA